MTSGGRIALRYVGLAAFDARGRSLPAWLAARPGGFVIRVDDRGARYPLRIDPFVQQGSKLVGSGAKGAALQGQSVALSADGSTALVGGPNDDGGVGAAWVFVRSGSTWTQQAKLVGTGAIGNAAQGSSVALSADGDTALVGGPNDNGFVNPMGAAWVFVRSGSTWTQQTKLVATDAIAANARQGSGVALSSGGDMALVGGPTANGFVGAAWVFVRSGATWTEQATLAGTGAMDFSNQGASVALSGDGSTALVGGPGDTEGSGAVWVFTRSGTSWTQGPKLAGIGGQSVALSGNGDTALVGNRASERSPAPASGRHGCSRARAQAGPSRRCWPAPARPVAPPPRALAWR